MREDVVEILEEGLEVEEVAQSAACCSTGPSAFKTGPET